MDYELLPYPVVLLAVPVGLRATCYYFREWYEKHLFRHPGQCGVEEGAGWRMSVLGSPLYLKAFYLHRYFFVLSAVLIIPHFLDAAATLGSAGYRLRFGNLLQWLDLVFLTLYVGTCHSFRYFLGSGEGCRSCVSGARSRAYWGQSRLNRYHGVMFWLSLFFLVAFASFVALQDAGVMSDFVVVGGS